FAAPVSDLGTGFLDTGPDLPAHSDAGPCLGWGQLAVERAGGLVGEDGVDLAVEEVGERRVVGHLDELEARVLVEVRRRADREVPPVVADGDELRVQPGGANRVVTIQRPQGRAVLRLPRL